MTYPLTMEVFTVPASTIPLITYPLIRPGPAVTVQEPLAAPEQPSSTSCHWAFPEFALSKGAEVVAVLTMGVVTPAILKQTMKSKT